MYVQTRKTNNVWERDEEGEKKKEIDMHVEDGDSRQNRRRRRRREGGGGGGKRRRRRKRKKKKRRKMK